MQLADPRGDPPHRVRVVPDDTHDELPQLDRALRTDVAAETAWLAAVRRITPEWNESVEYVGAVHPSM